MILAARSAARGVHVNLQSIVCGADSIMRGLLNPPFPPADEGALRCEVGAELPPGVIFLGDQAAGPCNQNLHVGSPAVSPVTGGSWRVQDAAFALPGWQALFNPTLFLMLVGINNLVDGETPATVAARLIAFRAMRSNIVLCGLTKTTIPGLQALVDQTNALFKPDARTDLINIATVDGIHPDAASSRLLAPPAHQAIMKRAFLLAA